jgi:hypothetical protein
MSFFCPSLPSSFCRPAVLSCLSVCASAGACAMFFLSLPALPLPQPQPPPHRHRFPLQSPPLRALPSCLSCLPAGLLPSQWTAPSQTATRMGQTAGRMLVVKEVLRWPAELVQQNMWCKRLQSGSLGWQFHAQVDQPAAWEQGLNSGM